MRQQRNARNWRLKRSRGGRYAFTMVELLLVLVILAILAGIVVPKFAGRSQDAKVTATKTEISGMESALDAFEIDNGYYPQGQNGLVSLFDQPSDASNWKGPYLKKLVINDPFGTPYIYECPGQRNVNGYDLSSAGPDKQAGSADDITNWEQTN